MRKRENRSIEKSQNELISYQLYCQRIFRNEPWVWVNICVCNKHYYVDVRVYHAWRERASYIHKNAVFHLMHGEHQHKTTQQINWIPINFILLVLSLLILCLPLSPILRFHIFSRHIFSPKGYRVRNILHLGLLSNIAHII